MAKLDQIHIVDLDSIPSKANTYYVTRSDTLNAANFFRKYLKEAVILEYPDSKMFDSLSFRSLPRQKEYYLNLKMINANYAEIIDSDETGIIGCICQVETERTCKRILDKGTTWTFEDRTSFSIVPNDAVYITGYFSITVVGSHSRSSYFELIKRKE